MVDTPEVAKLKSLLVETEVERSALGEQYRAFAAALDAFVDRNPPPDGFCWVVRGAGDIWLDLARKDSDE